MIRADNFKDVLAAYDFENDGSYYFKRIGNYEIAVDFTKHLLIYPQEIKGRDHNNSFAQKENFVVFECVCRLLEKGYRAENIELEKAWHLGRTPKGGRADICITDRNDSTLLIIECKTWGKELESALKDTKKDGAQLFSYWQQELSCKWLVLYASDIKENGLDHNVYTINCSDDKYIVDIAKRDKSIKLYSNASTAEQKYEVWKETYANLLLDDLVFSQDSVAYQIGIKPLRKRDLRSFTYEDVKCRFRSKKAICTE